MSECKHENFNALVTVNRLNKEGGDPNIIVAYIAEITVKCHDCGVPFEFFGLPMGASFYRPTVSINGREMRVPIVVPGTEPPPGLAGFSVTQQVFDEKQAVKQ